MSSPKVEKAVSLVHKIEAKRAELADLEREFEELISPARVVRRRVPHAARGANGAAGPRLKGNAAKALKILQKNDGSIKLKDLQARLGISDSGTASIVNKLIADGLAVKTGYGQYAAKS